MMLNAIFMPLCKAAAYAMRCAAGIYLLWVLILPGASLAAGAAAAAQATEGTETQPILLQFAPGKDVLDAGARSVLRNSRVGVNLRPDERILVFGYADAKGSRQTNYTLSYQRALVVRGEIIGLFGIGQDVVLATGRGPENPIADNREEKGRARNRRVEIYRVNLSDSRWKGFQKPLENGETAAIQELVRRAQDDLRRHRLHEALAVLQQARDRGGDRVGIWHTVYGISGYYAHAPLDKVRNHLQTALRFDPFDQDARDYLGRVEARAMVFSGAVTADMGRSQQDAIGIDSESQACEYLRLFDVRPVRRTRHAASPVTVWTCRDAQNRVVRYYFNHSQMLAWAFASEKKYAGPDGQQSTVSGHAARAGKSEAPVRPEGDPQAPGSIWDSKVFR